MKNRAKCKLCKDILESFHRYDYVTCKCGEISISGGRDTLECSAKDWSNFLRVDDEGNEIVVKVQERVLNPLTDTIEGIKVTRSNDTAPTTPPTPAKPTKQEVLKELHLLIESYEQLPNNALHGSATQSDVLSVLLLLSAALKADA